MPSLEERVAKLEDAVFRSGVNDQRPKDWRRTAGLFKNDPVMKEVIDEALRMRDEERRQARDEANGDRANGDRANGDGANGDGANGDGA